MKKSIFWIIIIIVVVLLLVWLGKRNSATTQPANNSTPATTNTTPTNQQEASFVTYHNDVNRYGLQYPASFNYDPASDTFTNKDVTKEGQPAFFKVMVMENSKKLTTQQWWDSAARQEVLSDVALQNEYAPVDIKTVGDKTVVVASPKDLGSSSYIFASGDKVVRINAFLVNDIEKVIESFRFDQ